MAKPGSGIVRYSYELTQALLDNDKHNEYIIYFKKGTVPKSLKLKGRFSIREIDLPYALWRTKLFTDILDKDGIDIYHSHGYTLPLVPASQRKVKLIATYHGLLPFWWSLRENIYCWYNFRFSAMFADRIISVSETVKQEIHKTYGKPLNAIDATYFGLNKEFKPLSQKQKKFAYQKIDQKYKLNGRKYVFYHGAGMRPNKNFTTMIKAWGILKNTYGLDIPLIITRVTTKPAYIANLIKQNGLEDQKDIIAIEWISDNKEQRDLFACAEISIYASLYDGLGFPIIEAQACGSPVITSNMAAMPEAAGGAAILVDKPEEATEWALTISNFFKTNKNIRKKMIAAGYLNAKKYNWKNVAERTIKIYEEMID